MDTLDFHYQSWNDAYAKFNCKFISKQDYLDHFAGTSGYEMISHLNKALNYSLSVEDITVTKDQIFIENYLLKITPIKQVLEIAQYYYSQGIKLVVASGGQKNVVEKLIKNNKIDMLFEDIIAIEDIRNGKPSPDIFIMAADRQKFLYDKCVVFEDVEAGFIAAKRANMAIVNINLL